MAKADDPRTWGTRAQAEARAKKIVNGTGGGIGLELGETGGGFALGGVDLDTCRASDGTIEPWAREVIERFASYSETSPSGTGFKVFFRYPAADLPELRAAMGTQHGREFKRGGGDHPPAIELHLSNRYFAVTGQHLDGTPDGLAIAGNETLLWLIREAGPNFARKDSEAKPKSNGSDNSRSAIAFRKGGAMRRAGFSFEAMCDALRRDPETAEWVSEKGEANSGRELRRIWEKAAPEIMADDAEIARLAKLPPLQYERERADAAEKLGCRAVFLDKLVAAARGAGEAADNRGQGRPIEIADIEPWPEPVNGAALLDELSRTIRQYAVLDASAADAAALWVLHTHALDAAFITPRLAITSPEKRCGKTTLLTLLSGLVARPLPSANMTAATIFRVIEAAHPTLLVDEADSFLGDAEDMRGIINAGHCRASATVLRNVETRAGYEVRAFEVFGPMAIAAIGKLPGTIEDRAVKIAMRRRRPEALALSNGARVHLDTLDCLARYRRALAGRSNASARNDGVATAGRRRQGGGAVKLKRPKDRTLPTGRPSGAQSELADRAARLGINHAFSSWDEQRQRLAEWAAA